MRRNQMKYCEFAVQVRVLKRVKQSYIPHTYAPQKPAIAPRGTCWTKNFKLPNPISVLAFIKLTTVRPVANRKVNDNGNT